MMYEWDKRWFSVIHYSRNLISSNDHDLHFVPIAMFTLLIILSNLFKSGFWIYIWACRPALAFDNCQNCQKLFWILIFHILLDLSFCVAGHTDKTLGSNCFILSKKCHAISARFFPFNIFFLVTVKTQVWFLETDHLLGIVFCLYRYLTSSVYDVYVRWPTSCILYYSVDLVLSCTFCHMSHISYMTILCVFRVLIQS